MYRGVLSTGATFSSYYAGWQPSGAWAGAFSGYRYSDFSNQGSGGYFWSSTASSIISARALSFSSYVNQGTSGSSKFYGFAVRCVLP